MSKKFSYKEFVYDDTELKDFMDDTPYSEGEAALNPDKIIEQFHISGIDFRNISH